MRLEFPPSSKGNVLEVQWKNLVALADMPCDMATVHATFWGGNYYWTKSQNFVTEYCYVMRDLLGKE